MKHEGERSAHLGNDNPDGVGDAPVGGRRGALTPREREVLALLADGLSGARIAERLVLSPETVRTHVRNAMAKLGASTRSQAVAIALRDEQIPGDSRSALDGPLPPGDPDESVSAALHQFVQNLVALYDLDGGVIYLADDDGLALRRAAATTAPGPELPETVALGHGPLAKRSWPGGGVRTGADGAEAGSCWVGVRGLGHAPRHSRRHPPLPR